MTQTTTTYRVVETPANGSVGQDVGTFALADLPPRLRDFVSQWPDAAELTLPALSNGDSGEPLDDLTIVITVVEPRETP